MAWGKLWVWMRRYFAACAGLVICLALLGRTVAEYPMPVYTNASAVPSDDTAETLVILDAGHGGEDCGAVGVNGVLEKDINLEISKNIGEYLRAAGVYVVETRTDDRLLYDPATVKHGHKKETDLANRAAVAARYDNAVFVSIHMNSFPGESSHGLQVWYGNGNDAGMRLAEEIQGAVVRLLQNDNHRRVKPSNGSMFLLDRISCPSVLVECGFLTNRGECEKLSDEGYQKELSFVIFCAIMNYIRPSGGGTS